MPRPAAFFDRDGVLIEDRGYVHRFEDAVWLPGAREAIRACNAAAYFVFVVTNQSGVARGLYDEAAIVALHEALNAQLGAIGAHIDAFEYCPDHPEGTIPRYRRACRRRKPEPGMILDLLESWPVDRAKSFLIGDRASDLAAAAAAGVAGHLYAGGDLNALVSDLLAKSTTLGPVT